MWNERYNNEEYIYGKMPNDFLVESIHLIPKGNVLSIADGEGRNSVFLARSGYAVTGVDNSFVGMEKARKLAYDNNVEVSYQCADLATYEIEPESWQGIVSIFCHLPPDLRKQVYAKAIAGLKSGGAFIIESYSPEQLSYGTGGPKDPALLPSVDTLREELDGLDLIVCRQTERVVLEGIGHSGMASTVQIVGIKH